MNSSYGTSGAARMLVPGAWETIAGALKPLTISVDIRPGRRFGFNLHDQEQWQAEIAHLP